MHCECIDPHVCNRFICAVKKWGWTSRKADKCLTDVGVAFVVHNPKPGRGVIALICCISARFSCGVCAAHRPNGLLVLAEWRLASGVNALAIKMRGIGRKVAGLRRHELGKTRQFVVK